MERIVNDVGFDVFWGRCAIETALTTQFDASPGRSPREVADQFLSISARVSGE